MLIISVWHRVEKWFQSLNPTNLLSLPIFYSTWVTRLGLGLAEWPLRVFTWEPHWWRWRNAYSQSAMDKPPQALSQLPTTSLLVQFSSPFTTSLVVQCSSSCSCSRFVFVFLDRMWSCLFLWVLCVFVYQENFLSLWVC